MNIDEIRKDPDVASTIADGAEIMNAVPRAITDLETCASAEKMLVAMTATLKRVEEKRKFFVGPLNAHVSAINTFFKEVSQPYSNVMDVLRKRVAAYRAEEKRRVEREAAEAKQAAAKAAREEAMRRACEEKAQQLAELGHKSAAAAMDQRAEEHAARIPAVRTVAPSAVPSGPVSVRRKWSFRVVDPALVPREYLAVDERAIRQAVTAGGVRSIPGVDIFEDSIAVVRQA